MAITHSRWLTGDFKSHYAAEARALMGLITHFRSLPVVVIGTDRTFFTR